MPSPEEWEFAALGRDGRRFPWGNTFDDALLPHPETRRVSADQVVGFYVRQRIDKSQSPFGILELVGGPSELVLTPAGPLREGVWGPSADPTAETNPGDYRVSRKPAPQGSRGAFRCAYDDSPH